MKTIRLNDTYNTIIFIGVNDDPERIKKKYSDKLEDHEAKKKRKKFNKPVSKKAKVK